MKLLRLGHCLKLQIILEHSNVWINTEAQFRCDDSLQDVALHCLIVPQYKFLTLLFDTAMRTLRALDGCIRSQSRIASITFV